MERKQVIRIFRSVVKELGIEGVKIRITPMKRKVASFSFKTKTLRLNSNIIDLLNEEQLKFIIFHELIHFKVRDVNHGSKFHEELEKYYDKEKTEQIELEIIKSLISTFS